MKKRTWLICLIICLIVLFVSFALPKSMGDTPAMIGGISMVLFVVFLFALIVSSIRSNRKEKHKVNDAPVAPSSSPSVIPHPITPDPAPGSGSAPTPAQSVPVSKKASTVERVHVRGVDKYADNVKSVGTENPDYSMTKRELQDEHPDERVYQYDFYVKASLVPEPDNEYDPNAIMVQADGLCIGYVPKGSTAHIRKLMEAGRIKRMDLNIGGGKYKEVSEIDDDEYELEKGSLPFSAVLDLHLTEE